MKRNFTFLMAAFALMMSMMMPLGMKGQTRAEAVVYTLDGTQTGGNNGYATESDITQDGVLWKVKGNTTMNPWRLGGNSISDEDRPIYSTSAFSDNITKVVVTTGTTSGSITINSVKLVVSGASNFSNATTLSANWVASSTITFTRPANADWSSKYFKIIYNVTVSGTSNKYAEFVKADFYKESTGIPCTVTFNPGNGTCTTASVTENSGTSITLPTATPSTTCADAGWTFAGWATQSISETTTAPTLLTGSYTISGNVTLYAVYKDSDQQITVFNIADIADENGWSSGTQYTTITKNGITLTASGGGNDGKYYSSDETWRFYSSTNGTVTVSASNNDVVGVTSNPQKTFTISNGVASYVSSSSNTSFKSITVICGALTCTYATSPSCSAQQQVATPTFTPEAGTYTTPQNVTISCTTSDATIHYTTDGSTPSESSPTYSGAIAVSTTTTIKAIAVKSGMSNSAVATATYTIESSGGDGTVYTLYTGNLIEGDYIIYYSGKAMKNTVSSNRLQYETITPSGNTITTSDDAIIWHIAPSGDYWTIYNEAVGKFAASTGIENKAQLLDSGTDDMSLWTVEGNSTYEFVNKKNAANNVNKNLRNNGQYGFACYGIGTGGALSLYRSTAPSIVANQTIELAHDATSGAFDYSITNPVTGTSLTATANADWITNVTVGTEQVTFTATANTTGVERMGTITLQYDGAQDKTVTITQAVITPVLETSNVPSTPFAYTGTAGSFDLTITNPVDGAITTATSTNAWITNVAVSGNTVNFQVAQNDGLARSGEITLTYAKNGITLATATVTINQDSNPVLPGGADNPYTVAQAVDTTPSSGTSGFVYVRGIVSEIIEIEVMQYHNARYYISDDGSTNSTQLLAFYGRNINNTDFLSEDELLVGDEVVVYGQLKKYNDTEELDRGNYIVSLTRAVQPVTFNPGSCVTPESIRVNLFTESLFDYDGTQIYYTTNGFDPRTSGTAFEDAWAADLELTQTTTIKAAARVPELGKWSAVTEATYTFVPEGSGGWQGQPYTVSEALAALDQNSDIKGAYVHGIVSRVSQIDTTLYYNATYYISEDGEENNELYVFRGKYISRSDFTSTDQLKPGDQVTVYGDLTVYHGTTKEFKPKNYIENWYRPASIIINPEHFDFSSNVTSGLIHVTYSSDILVNDYNPTVQFCDADGETATYDWLTVTPSGANDWDLEFIIDANEGDQSRTAYLRVWGRDNQSNDIVSNIISITQSEYKVDFAELPFSFSGGHNDIDDTPGLTGEYLGTYAAENTRLKFVNPSADQISMLVLKINEVPGVLTYDIKGNVMVGGTFKVQQSSNGITYSDVASYSGLANESLSVTIDNLSPSTRYIRWIYATKNTGNVGVGNIHLSKPIVTYDLMVNNPMDGETQIGAISANPAGPSIPAGTDVALSISYDNNSYYFVEWVVTDDSDNPVAVTDNHFTMPAANVTVTATLVSVNTPCAYAFSVNGQMGDQQSVTMGNAVQMPTNSDITFNGQTFTFSGWTTNPDNVTDLLRAGTNYTMMHDETFYAVYNQQVTDTEAEKQYAKVTRELSDWSGDYLIVYEEGNVAFNGALETLDAASNTVAVTIANGIINATETMNAAKFTIAAIDGGYSIKSASGKYIGRDASSNGLNAHATTVYVNTISYTPSGVIEIQGAGGAYLKYNTSSDNTRFRYYMSGQKPIQLYKYVGSVNNLYTRIFMNETASSVTIEGPSIIPNGSVLNMASITNTLGADRLLVDEGGQLVTSSDVNATVRKTITPYAELHGTDHYYLIASPVDDLDPTTAGMTGDDFDLFAFDQSFQGEEWRNYKADDFNLAARQGYLYANNYGGFINMGGTMAATVDDVTITKVSGNFAGLNLIGNPYPCNVTIDKPFYRLAEGGAALATEATDNTVAIAPMEGVFVCADGPETVSFTKAPTTSTTGGRNLLSMRVSRNRNSKDDRVDTDNAIVRFGEGAMLRKQVLNPDLSQLYVAQGGTDYAIVNAEAEGELPVSFRAATNGSYTFSVAAEGVTMRYLHLIDLKTGADVDLLQTPYYTFTAQTTDYESRFRLVFATGSSTSSETGNFAYYDGSQWVVSSEGEATLQVVDMMGRVLSSQNVNGSAELNLNQSQGMYVLRLINNNEIKTQKIINY